MVTFSHPEKFKLQSSLVLLLFSCLVMSNSLQPHGLQHARLPYPSPCPGACSNSCLLSLPSNHFILWHPLLPPSISPASGSFPMSRFFTSGGQSIGALASVLPMNIQDLFPLGLTRIICLQFKGFSRVFSNTTGSNSSLVLSLLYGPALTSVHDYWKNHSFD